MQVLEQDCAENLMQFSKGNTSSSVAPASRPAAPAPRPVSFTDVRGPGVQLYIGFGITDKESRTLLESIADFKRAVIESGHMVVEKDHPSKCGRSSLVSPGAMHRVFCAHCMLACELGTHS
jgi:hypothetical protein